MGGQYRLQRADDLGLAFGALKQLLLPGVNKCIHESDFNAKRAPAL